MYILTNISVDEFGDSYNSVICVSKCKLKLERRIEELKSSTINKNERIRELDEFFKDNLEDTIEDMKDSELPYSDIILAHNTKMRKLYDDNPLEYIEWVDIRDEYVVHDSYVIQEVSSLDE